MHSYKRGTGNTLRRALLIAAAVVASTAAVASAAARGGFEHERPEGLTGTWRVQVTTYNCHTGAANATFASFLTLIPSAP